MVKKEEKIADQQLLSNIEETKSISNGSTGDTPEQMWVSFKRK